MDFELYSVKIKFNYRQFPNDEHAIKIAEFIKCWSENYGSFYHGKQPPTIKYIMDTLNNIFKDCYGPPHTYNGDTPEVDIDIMKHKIVCERTTRPYGLTTYIVGTMAPAEALSTRGNLLGSRFKDRPVDFDLAEIMASSVHKVGFSEHFMDRIPHFFPNSWKSLIQSMD